MRPSHLEPAQDGRHPPLQVVPSLVPAVHHVLESAGGVGAVLAGQAAVLFVDELQLGQTLLDLPLKGLGVKNKNPTVNYSKTKYKKSDL